MNISQIWDLGERGHAHFDFVDVDLDDDNLVFIDPILLEKNWEHPLAQEATAVMEAFFDKFFVAYRTNDRDLKHRLLRFAGEENAPRLGYGNGYNGHGNTAEGLIYKFKPLEELIKSIKTLSKPQDLPVFIPGFAEDGLSDMLVNILHDQLYKFTREQMKKYGIKPNKTIPIIKYNANSGEWEKVERDCYEYRGKEVLLVPKQIVRDRYLFNVGQYFGKIIIDRIREEGGYRDAEGKQLPKKTIVKNMSNSDNPHWRYEKAIDYTKAHNDALSDYHYNIGGYYLAQNYGLTDEELDVIIYEKSHRRAKREPSI